MNRFNFIISVFCLMLFAVTSITWAQPVRKKVKEGNQHYQEESYDQALNKYRDAQVDDPELSLLEYNIGNAQYKMNKYEEAIAAYEKSLLVDDAMKQAESYYNLGNTQYRMNKLPEAIESYKKALELNPDDEDAKYNLEYVRKKLKDQSEKQQQNQQQQQQDQQQQGQNQDQQDQNQDQQQQNQQQQEEQGQQQQQDQQQQSDEGEEEQEQQQPQPQPQEGQQQELSKKDAEQLLKALQEDEENLKEARKQKVSGRPQVMYDW